VRSGRGVEIYSSIYSSEFLFALVVVAAPFAPFVVATVRAPSML
jgi:hypothetical protein